MRPSLRLAAAFAAGQAAVAFAQTPTTTIASATPGLSAYGQAVELRAHVKACTGCSYPGGSIDLVLDGASIGSFAVVDGDAATTLTGLQPGSHSLVASYSGDAGNLPSTSSSITFGPVPAATDLRLFLFGGAAGALGQPIAVTTLLIVPQPGGGTPTGTIVVSDGVGDECTIVLPATECSLTPQAAGPLTLVGRYSGSATHGPSVGAVNVAVAASGQTIGGSIDGLSGSGLVLRLASADGSQDLPVGAGTTAFSFPQPVAYGSYYNVTVAGQPTRPEQGCTVADGAGSVQGTAITNVAVHCATAAHAVRGIVAGLVGHGLVLQIGGGGAIAVDADGGFAFAPLADGSPYSVTVAAQPSAPAQQCTVVRGSGVVDGADVADVFVGCTGGGKGGEPALAITVDDGTPFAAYGGVQRYIVTLANGGTGAAGSVTVMGSPTPGLDGNNAQWQCTPSGGAQCTSGSGNLFTTVDLPAGASAAWVVDIPVEQQVPDDTVTFQVSAPGAGAAQDTDVLVVFRNGFDGAP